MVWRQARIACVLMSDIADRLAQTLRVHREREKPAPQTPLERALLLRHAAVGQERNEFCPKVAPDLDVFL